MNRRESDASSSVLGHRREAWPVLATALLVALPLVVTSMPPVMDYPNHLVRIWLLAGGAALPPLSSVYVVDWSQAATNIGVDWVAAQLAQVLPFPVLDRLLRLLMFLGPPLGAVCLGRAVFGRITAWQAAPLAMVWGTTSIAGFLNYSISLGAALLFAAILYHWKRLAPATLLAHALFATILLVIHPFGLLFYLALLMGIVIGPAAPFPPTWNQLRRLLVESSVVAAIGLAPLIAMFAFSDAAPAVNTVVQGGLWRFHPYNLARTFLSPILTYDLAFDLLLVLPLLLVAMLITFTGKWRLHFGLLLVSVLLLLLAVVTPNELGDAAWLDRRFPLMAALTLAAAIDPRPLGRRMNGALIAALLVAVIGKAGWVAYVWQQREQDLADLRAVASTIEPGDTVMVVKNRVSEWQSAPLGRYMADTQDPVRAHLPTLLIKEKRALIPTLFAIPGQQPIRVVGLPRSPERGMSSFAPYAPDVNAGEGRGYIAGWRCGFRYLLLLGADEPTAEPFDTNGLTLVRTREFAALYAVQRTDSNRSCD